MKYRPFIPNVAGLLPAVDETGNNLLPEVEQPNVAYVAYVAGKKEDICIEGLHIQHDAEGKVYSAQKSVQEGGHVPGTGNKATLEVFPEVEALPARATTGNKTGNKNSAPTDDLAFTLADANVLSIEPLPPMRIVTDRPPLPVELWLNGLTPATALAAHRRLKQEYFCSCGKDAAGWFVRCDPKHYEVVAP